MTTQVLRSCSAGLDYEDERIREAWEKVSERLKPLDISIWVSEFRDHKGMLIVTWEVKPTKKMMKDINDIWRKDYNESSTEHVFNEIIIS